MPGLLLQFPGGLHVAKPASREALLDSAGDWFGIALGEFELAACAMQHGDLAAADGHAKCAEEASAHFRADLAEASKQASS